MVSGSRRRSFTFRVPTGKLEMRIAEIPEKATPGVVTMLLSAALADVGGEKPTSEYIERLCVADRQYLLRALLVELGHGELWISTTCAGCGAPFDAQIVLSALPVQDAVEYPETTVETSLGLLRIRVPNSSDQAAILSLDRDKAMPALAARLITGVENGSDFQPWRGGELRVEDVDAMNERMDKVFPAVINRVQTACPECRRLGTLDVSPLRLLRRVVSSVFPDVDLLARYYHWSESAILQLPCRRRMQYVRYLDHARGFAG